MTKQIPSDQLKATLTDLQRALNEWENVKVENPNEEALDIRKKTQELVKKLNEQIEELGL